MGKSQDQHTYTIVMADAGKDGQRVPGGQSQVMARTSSFRDAIRLGSDLQRKIGYGGVTRVFIDENAGGEAI